MIRPKVFLFSVLTMILLATNLYANESLLINELFNTKSFTHFKAKLDTFRNNSNDTVKCKFYIDLDREIIDSFNEVVIEIESYTTSSETNMYKKYNRYCVNILRNNDDIFFLAYNEIDNRSRYIKCDSGYVRTDSINETMMQLRHSFRRKYKKELNFDDLFTNDIVFGHYCGFIGYPPPYRDSVYVVLAKIDTAKIQTWLRSACLEKQLYAYECIVILAMEGILFNEETMNIVNSIPLKDADVYSCQGCVHQRMKVKDLARKIRRRKRITYDEIHSRIGD